MPRWLASVLILLCAALAPATACLAFDPAQTGVLVLHGKHGDPGGFVASFVDGLRQAGFVAQAMEQAWSRRRGYDVGYLEALDEIGRQLDGLKARGAQRLVLAGHSMGAGAALAYAARNTSGPALSALVCLAPGHTPDVGRQHDVIVEEVARARELVAQGRAGERVQFRDLNVGRQVDTWLSAGVFLSYFDPEGPAVMPLNAGLARAPLPVLWIVGSRDTVTRPPAYAFDRLPKHPASRYQALDADHVGAVAAALPVVADWLKGL